MTFKRTFYMTKMTLNDIPWLQGRQRDPWVHEIHEHQDVRDGLVLLLVRSIQEFHLVLFLLWVPFHLDGLVLQHFRLRHKNQVYREDLVDLVHLWHQTHRDNLRAKGIRNRNELVSLIGLDIEIFLPLEHREMHGHHRIWSQNSTIERPKRFCN